MPSIGRRPSSLYVSQQTQSSHTIPQELFQAQYKNKRPAIILLYKQLTDEATLKKFLDAGASINRQPLPAHVHPRGSSVHNGNHDGFTNFVKQRLAATDASFRNDPVNKADLARLGDPSLPSGERALLRQQLAERLQRRITEEVAVIQFRSTNFVDEKARLFYSRNEFELFKQTDVWKETVQGDPAKAQRILGKVNGYDAELQALFEQHNTNVGRLDLTDQQKLEMKVLKDLAKTGTIAHTNGTVANRDAVRALIAHAETNGVRLSERDAANYLVDVMDTLNAKVASYQERIKEIDKQLKTATGATAEQLSDLKRQLTQELAEANNIGGMGGNKFAKSMLEIAEHSGAKSAIRGISALFARLGLGSALGLLLSPQADAALLVQGLLSLVGIDPFSDQAIANSKERFGRIEEYYRRQAGATNGTYAQITGENGEKGVLVPVAQPPAEDGTIETVYVFASSLPREDSSIFDVVRTFSRGAIEGARDLGAFLRNLLSDDAGAVSGTVFRADQAGSKVEVFEQQGVDESLAVGTSRVGEFDAEGNQIGERSETSAYARDPQSGRLVLLDFKTVLPAIGSTLVSLLEISNPLQRIAAETVVGSIAGRIAGFLDGDQGGLTLDNLRASFAELDVEITRQGIGAVSSYLFAELVEEFGLSEHHSRVLQSLGGAAVTQIAINLATKGAGVFDNVGKSVQNASGSFIGTYFATKAFHFDTRTALITAQLGASVGASIGAKVGLVAGPIGALIGSAVGAFIGYLYGGLIGSLFAGTPRSGAEVSFDGREFGVGRVWARSGGSKEAARSLAMTAVSSLNSLLEVTGSKVADSGSVRLGAYGTRGKKYTYQVTTGPDAGRRTLTTFDSGAVVNLGVAITVSDLLPRLVGGDVFVKRAIGATLRLSNVIAGSNAGDAAGSFEVTALFGNITTARDYARYQREGAAIDAAIAADPQSAFAATWTATIARAHELGLHKRADTDWVGGWNALLDEVDGSLDGVAISPALLELGLDVRTNERIFELGDSGVATIADAVDSKSKDEILGTDNADTIIVTGDRIADSTGLTIDGAAASGEHVIDVAAFINGDLGDDTIVGGDLGNDLLGSDGNDTLVGGKLDDWLFGGEGDDRLFAGAANYRFADGDQIATAAALAVAGNGDLLDGGDGNDTLYGSAGSDWLNGGDGVDTLYGGAGGDIIEGGAGDDRGANGEARLLGGAGTDQYLFNYGDGRDVIFDESDATQGPGSTGDSLFTRQQQLNSGALGRNWAGGGDYEVDGSVRGGEDSIAFGFGISFSDLILRRSGTTSAPGQDLIIQLTIVDPDTNVRLLTGDELVIKDWFESTRRVEWLRFANGDDIRIGDLTSFIVGSSAADVIIGTNGADFLYGGGGNDTLRGLNGHDFAFGGEGNDLVAGDEDNDFVAGGSGDDDVLGGDGNDTVFGDDGADEVYGGAGSDIVVGGLGDDMVVGGGGNDIFRYQRGDGRDTIFDEYVDNWESVWQNGTYINGYVLNTSTGVVTKNGVTVFDGARWDGLYDYSDATRLFRRHLGTVNGALAGNSGFDFIEFGVGIDIQDLQLRRNGVDLQIAIGNEDGSAFDDIADRITIKDWYLTGNAIENFVFAATGRHTVSSWSLAGGSDSAETIAGTGGIDWITGNGGDDVITGEAGDDILAGNAGADTLRGGAGKDVLFGGDADDVLEGGADADQLLGGNGADIASYASSGALRVMLSSAETSSGDAVGDVYVGIEGIEGSAGNDVLGTDDGENVLRGLAGSDTLYGGAGDDIYEVELGHGQDVIRDAPFHTEVVVAADGTLNSEQYTATWTFVATVTLPSGTRDSYRLIVTRNGTGEEVYRSRDGVDFLFVPSFDLRTGERTVRRLPPASSWPSANGQWINGAMRTGNGAQAAREVLDAGNGGDDTLELGAGISLSDLTFERANGAADLRIRYSASDFITIAGQADANRAIETLQLRDGLSANLTRLRLAGELATAEDDFVVGDAANNTLIGLGGDDVLSGGAGGDVLVGGDGEDILEGGAGGDVLDGGGSYLTGAVELADLTGSSGDTIRYVRSSAGVTIDLLTLEASGGDAAGDNIVANYDIQTPTGEIIVATSGISTIENVVGSDGFGDTLRGDARINRLAGLGGDDRIEGRGGDDILLGGMGNDTLQGGDGDDALSGDEGADTLSGDAGKDEISGGDGNDRLFGGTGNDTLNGGNGDDILQGGADADQLGGDAGNDQVSGDDGDDKIAGGEGNDILRGGEGNDVLAGESGSDQLFGDAGDDTYVFDANDDADTIVDALGTNRIVFSDVSPDQVWLTRSGNDLRIGIVGGTTFVTVSNYYATSGASRVREIALGTHSLFLAHAEPLIAAMTAQGAATPVAMPEAVAQLRTQYWHTGGKAAPRVVDQERTTDDLTTITGTVGAIDHDDNITGYAIEDQPEIGALTLDAATGQWTYTPDSELSGTDTFRIRVTDADGNTSSQLVTVNVTPTERALKPVIQIAQAALPEAPLGKVTLDSGSWTVHIQGALADTDRSEALEVRVSNVPDGITFDTGVNLGGGVWSFGGGPWPTRIFGPANWSQDLSLVITASSREIANGRMAEADPVMLNIEINARPTDIVPATELTFDENAAAGAMLTTLSMSDGDAGDTGTYTLLDDAGGRFTLDADGTLRAGSTALDYEGATKHRIRVLVTDSGGLTYERELDVAVRNVNEAPLVADQTRSTSEDTPLSGSVGASDPDGNIASYELASDPARGVIALNQTTGAWTYTPGSNQHGADTFQIRVTDAGGLSTVQTVTVDVASVNDAPSEITLSDAPSGIAENDRPAAGTTAAAVVLGTLSASDVDAPDAGDFATHVFSVTDDRFEIVDGNILRLRAGAVLDFEAATSIAVSVAVRDRNGAATGLSFTRTFTLSVLDRDDYFYGTAQADALTGTAGRNLIYGQGGDDTLTGANASDLLDGGDGADQLFGLDGNDELVGALGDDTLDGGVGDDRLDGGDGDDTLLGQDGTDTLLGDIGADVLLGGAGDDLLDGGAGNDRLEGGDGNDRLVGGAGDDVLAGGAGADRFSGGEGSDTVTYENASSGVSVDLAAGTGSAGEAAGDVFEDAPEVLIGSAHADTLVGSSGADTLHGHLGDDHVSGGAGNDTLSGGAGNDVLEGGAGDDMLWGGAGDDILIGGDGSDTYMLGTGAGADEIRNFDPSGADIDVLGYSDVTHQQIWFQRSGEDLVLCIVGTTVRTTIKDWYRMTSDWEKSNHKIDFFLAGDRQSMTIDAEALVELMADYPPPATQAEFDALLASPAFMERWAQAWRLNAAPVIPVIADMRVNEDGTLTVTSAITDDFTPAGGITVTVEAVNVDDHATPDLRIVNAPTISAADAGGERTLTIATRPNASGQVAIKITATDAGGLSSQRIFVLTVDAVADAPKVTVAEAVAPPSPLTVNSFEAGPIGLDLQAALTDKDGSEILEIRVAGVPDGITLSAGTKLDDGVWSLTPAQLTGLQLIGPATWSGQLALTVTAIARETSTGQTALSEPVALAIQINARPTAITASAALSVDENTAPGTELLTFSSVDPDGAVDSVFELVDDAGGRFTLSRSGTLSAGDEPLDFESAESHVIKVRVTDHGGLTLVKEFTVAVNDLNEAPTDIVPPGTLEVAENAAANTIVGAFTRTDADANDTATYSLVSDAAGRFKIDADGTLRATGSELDFEDATSHTVRVRVTDAGGLAREEDFSVAVTNVNEAPTDITWSGKLEVYEDATAGTLVASLGRADADAGDTATYSLVSDADGRFSIGSDGKLYTGSTALNYSNATSHTVRVRVTDAAGLTYEEDIAIAVIDRNSAPVDLNPEAPLSVAENMNDTSKAIGRIIATDPDSGDTLSFSIYNPDGTPLDAGGRFRIGADGYLYRGTTALDYETATSHTFTVQVIDSGGESYTEELTIAVTDANDVKPTVTAHTFSISENVGATVLGTISASDGDVTAAFRDLRFELVGSDASLFTIDSKSGRVSTVGAFNYEARTSYQIGVRVWDGGAIGAGNATTANSTLNITNVDELPTVNAPAATVNEGHFGGPGGYLTDTAGNYVRITGSDPEGKKLSYEVIGGNGEFSVDSDGYVHVQNVVLDYEARTSYSLSVRVWDGGSIGAGNSVDRTIPITVANVNEGPRLVQVSHVAVPISPDGPLDPNPGFGTADYDHYYGFVFADPEGDAVSWVQESEFFGLIRGDMPGTAQVEHAYFTITLPQAVGLPGDFVLTLTASDVRGAQATSRVRFYDRGRIQILPPVVLDLDGDGIELTPLAQSQVYFDMDGNGSEDRTGWVGADDALLVLDRNRDGVIGSGAEISFIGDLPGAQSDLEGLQAFDTNANHAFDSGDERFAEFQVWRDANQDGVSQAAELHSLAELGIASIDLTRGLTGNTSEGATDNVITAISVFTRTDGTQGEVGDVQLAFQSTISIEDDSNATSSDLAARSRWARELAREGLRLPRALRQALAAADERAPSIDDVDRSADDDRVTPPEVEHVSSPKPHGPQTGEHADAALPESSKERSDDYRAGAAQRRDRKWPSLEDLAQQGTDDEQWQGYQPPAQVQSALHASLSAVARGRLQMIEALATFAPEEAANLSLMPARKVDARTLELLTSVHPYRAALR